MKSIELKVTPDKDEKMSVDVEVDADVAEKKSSKYYHEQFLKFQKSLTTLDESAIAPFYLADAISAQTNIVRELNIFLTENDINPERKEIAGNLLQRLLFVVSGQLIESSDKFFRSGQDIAQSFQVLLDHAGALPTLFEKIEKKQNIINENSSELIAGEKYQQLADALTLPANKRTKRINLTQLQLLGFLKDQGDRCAYDAIVCWNLKLADSIAWRITKKIYKSGVELDDLIQAGRYALQKAVYLFDWHQGSSFANYAWIAIGQRINRFIEDTSKDIRVPIYIYSLRRKILKTMKSAPDADLQKPYFDEGLIKKFFPELSEEYLEAIQLLESYESIPWDETVFDKNEEDPYEGGFIELQELIPEIEGETPESLLIKKEFCLKIPQLLKTLNFSPKEEEVIIQNIFNNKTLQETGDALGLSRERIRQIREKAMRKFRHPNSKKWIKAYL